MEKVFVVYDRAYEMIIGVFQNREDAVKCKDHNLVEIQEWDLQ